MGECFRREVPDGNDQPVSTGGTLLRKHSPTPPFAIHQMEEETMALKKEQKSSIISDFKHHDTDTGSSEVQIALLTTRITELTEHFKTHGKDHHSRRGLLKLVSQRRKLLDHLKAEDVNRYQKIIAQLGIRR